MEDLFTFQNLLTLLSLSGLEIVLGIDNVIFLAILVYNIPAAKRAKVRLFGISLAIILRIGMLSGVSWVMNLTKILFTFLNIEFSGRSLLLLVGGAFLIIKSAIELSKMIIKPKHIENNTVQKIKTTSRFNEEIKVIVQIIFVDLVLSFDSVIVAVGMANNLYLIVPAILAAMVVMLVSAKPIGDFMYANPSI